jgi:hypothetical protein
MYVKTCDIVLSDSLKKKKGVLSIEWNVHHLYQVEYVSNCSKDFFVLHLFTEDSTAVCILMPYKLCIEGQSSPLEFGTEG